MSPWHWALCVTVFSLRRADRSKQCRVWHRTQGACLINPSWRPPSSDKHVCGTVLFCSLFCCTCMPTVSLHGRESPFVYTSFYCLCFTASFCSFVMFFRFLTLYSANEFSSLSEYKHRISHNRYKKTDKSFDYDSTCVEVLLARKATDPC